jgi:hypothetical protein
MAGADTHYYVRLDMAYKTGARVGIRFEENGARVLRD